MARLKRAGAAGPSCEAGGRIRRPCLRSAASGGSLMLRRLCCLPAVKISITTFTGDTDQALGQLARDLVNKEIGLTLIELEERIAAAEKAQLRSTDSGVARGDSPGEG